MIYKISYPPCSICEIDFHPNSLQMVEEGWVSMQPLLGEVLFLGMAMGRVEHTHARPDMGSG
jgi:hypothetical protein